MLKKSNILPNSTKSREKIYAILLTLFFVLLKKDKTFYKIIAISLGFCV